MFLHNLDNVWLQGKRRLRGTAELGIGQRLCGSWDPWPATRTLSTWPRHQDRWSALVGDENYWSDATWVLSFRALQACGASPPSTLLTGLIPSTGAELRSHSSWLFELGVGLFQTLDSDQNIHPSLFWSLLAGLGDWNSPGFLAFRLGWGLQSCSLGLQLAQLHILDILRPHNYLNQFLIIYMFSGEPWLIQ